MTIFGLPFLKRSVVVVAMLALLAPVADASWLSRLVREGVEASGGVAGKGAKVGLGFGALDDALARIRVLQPGQKSISLAAEATPEGHWRFVNKSGDVFTAGTPDELRRAISTLVPEAATRDVRIALYLTEDSVFRHRAFLKELPVVSDLHIVVGKRSYKLIQRSEQLLCEVKPNVLVELGARTPFDDAIWQLSRPLNKSNIRTLSLEPGGPKNVASVPRLDPITKSALVDFVDPAALPAAFSSVRGQTVLISGRSEGSVLHYKPANGSVSRVEVSDLVDAARHHDVNLVILKSMSERQPGGRNWLWQKISVSGLDAALQRATLADFLDVLGARRGQLVVSANADGLGRVSINAVPTGPASAPITGTIGGWLEDATSKVTGNVLVHAVELNVRDQARQGELDRRLIPGIPSVVQYGYVFALVVGLFGLAYARTWWAKVWPPETREDYRGPVGYHAARIVRLLIFSLVFLPLVSVPAFLVTTVMGFWGWLSAALKLVGRMLRWRTGVNTS